MTNDPPEAERMKEYDLILLYALSLCFTIFQSAIPGPDRLDISLRAHSFLFCILIGWYNIKAVALSEV